MEHTVSLETGPGVHAWGCTYMSACCAHVCIYVQVSQCLLNIYLMRGQVSKKSSHIKSIDITAELVVLPLT